MFSSQIFVRMLDTHLRRLYCSKLARISQTRSLFLNGTCGKLFGQDAVRRSHLPADSCPRVTRLEQDEGRPDLHRFCSKTACRPNAARAWAAASAWRRQQPMPAGAVNAGVAVISFRPRFPISLRRPMRPKPPPVRAAAAKPRTGIPRRPPAPMTMQDRAAFQPVRLLPASP